MWDWQNNGTRRNVTCEVTPTAAGSDTIVVYATAQSYLSTSNDRYSIGRFTVTVAGPSAWFQTLGAGDIVANGSISTNIPSTCLDPDCSPQLIVADEDSGIPGVAIHKNNLSVTPSVSVKNWAAQTAYAKDYSYEYFESISSGKTFTVISNTLDTGLFNSVPADPLTGFSWLKASGDITINNPLNISNNKKAVIFVDGNLNINNEIRMNSPETSFVMFVVRGDIIVDPSIGNNNANSNTPNISGIFWADGAFISNSDSPASDTKLVVRGSVATNGGFSLQRDLGNDNQTFPAEVFIYAPEFQLNFPDTLSEKRLVWKEVAP